MLDWQSSSNQPHDLITLIPLLKWQPLYLENAPYRLLSEWELGLWPSPNLKGQNNDTITNPIKAPSRLAVSVSKRAKVVGPDGKVDDEATKLAREKEVERRKNLVAAFKAKHEGAREVMEIHTITTHKTAPLRSVPAGKVFEAINRQEERTLELAMWEADQNYKFMIYAAVYGRRSCTVDDRDLLIRAVDVMEAKGMIRLPEQQRIAVAQWQGVPYMVLIMGSEQVYQWLVAQRAITYKTEGGPSGKEAITFMFSKVQSWGDALFLDIHGWHGTKESAGALLLEQLGDGVKETKGKDGKKSRTLSIAKASVSKNAEGTKAKTYRAKILMDDAKFGTVPIPTILKGADSEKGDVTITLPEFCGQCASWSHNQRECMWWAEDGVVGKTTKPSKQEPLSWKTVIAGLKAKTKKKVVMAGEEMDTSFNGLMT